MLMCPPTCATTITYIVLTRPELVYMPHLLSTPSAFEFQLRELLSFYKLTPPVARPL